MEFWGMEFWGMEFWGMGHSKDFLCNNADYD